MRLIGCSAAARANASFYSAVRGIDRIWFHDPLAAATIFNDGICRFERGAAEVELTSPKLMGMTHWKADAAGRHEVAVSVDCDAFFAEYFSVFGGA